jgi:hypothetical protein
MHAHTGKRTNRKRNRISGTAHTCIQKQKSQQVRSIEEISIASALHAEVINLFLIYVYEYEGRVKRKFRGAQKETLRGKTGGMS